MDFKSVLVQNDCKVTNSIIGSSGVMINERFVITTANVMIKNVLKRHPLLLTNFKPGKIHKFEDQCDLKLSAMWKKTSGLFNVRSAKIFGLIICENIRTSNREIFRDWAYDSIENNRGCSEVLSVFFILKIQGQAEMEEFKNSLRVWFEQIARVELEKGQELRCETVPFANRLFLDTHCRGIASNIIGENSCMILSDCPTAPGSEGSPVYISEGVEKFPIGLVIFSVCWWKGEWVGLTLVADFRPLLAQVVEMHFTYIENGQTIIRDKKPCIEVLVPANYSVVQVYSGNTWGTGVLLSKEKGIFITNAHVVENETNLQFYWRNLSARGKIIYKTSEDSAFDLAILECNPEDDFLKNLSPCRLYTPSDINYNSGDTVYCVGYPLLPRTAGVSPTITRGHLTATSAYMLRTTCSVHPGASGGGVFDEEGRLLGIVVCSAKLEHGGVYPRVNAAVPVAPLAGVLEAFLETGDISNLENLHTNNLEATIIWKRLEGKL